MITVHGWSDQTLVIWTIVTILLFLNLLPKKKTICPAVSVVRISCLRRLRNQKMCQAMAMTRGLSGSLGVSRGLSGSLGCIGFWQGIRLGDLVISKRVARSWLEMIMNHVLEYLNTAESS